MGNIATPLQALSKDAACYSIISNHHKKKSVTYHECGLSVRETYESRLCDEHTLFQSISNVSEQTKSTTCAKYLQNC